MNLPLVLILSAPFLVVAQPTWCRKNYKQGSPVVAPGGQSQVPDKSNVTKLYLECPPRVKPYLFNDEASLVVDARVLTVKVPGAVPFLRPPDAVSLNRGICRSRSPVGLTKM